MSGTDFALLQHGLAAGDLNQPAARTQRSTSLDHFFQRAALAAGESVLAVAPGTTQIAARKPNKDTRQPRMGDSP